MTKEELNEIISVNLGRASMCWSEIPRGLYDGAKAAELRRQVMEAIDQYVESQEERELIKKILDDRSNANGHDKEGNPKYIYDGYEYILNTSCNKILSMSFERKFKLEDSFKKAMERIPSWMDEYREEYDKLLKSGMFFEIYPELTGEWEEDMYAFCHDRKYKKPSPQDPASRDITIEDIHRIAKEMFEEETIDDILEIEETDEEAAYRKGYTDGYDEGLYDGQYK
jgi:predicted RNase H-like HicB family nuclease